MGGTRFPKLRPTITICGSVFANGCGIGSSYIQDCCCSISKLRTLTNEGASRMRKVLSILLGVVCCTALSFGQTAEELIAKNTEAKGGIERIKAIKAIKAVG